MSVMLFEHFFYLGSYNRKAEPSAALETNNRLVVENLT